jgi:aspartyl/asparaginyl beta-hydroxylase (cupin superfamily)
MDISFTAPEEEMEKYPTARKLIQEYGDNCPIASYSVLAPNTILQRHTGVENRSGEFIRIHIPLIIPEGDVFFEANGEEIDWSDLWAFHNQFAHSAHNNTNEWRLVFLLDIRRTFIGLEPGMPYDIKNESTYMKPFVRQKKPS